MKGMNRSGNPGIVQPMQMPPTLGQPPMPPIHPRFETLQFTTDPQHPCLARHLRELNEVAKSACSLKPVREQPSRAIMLKSQVGRPSESSEMVSVRPAMWKRTASSVSMMLSGFTGQPGTLITGSSQRDRHPLPR